jgi:hypothetical protein
MGVRISGAQVGGRAAPLRFRIVTAQSTWKKSIASMLLAWV